MSEYQYYQFLAIDRPLDADDMRALRAISYRATITPTSFTNHYEWGDLKADPATMVRRWFDLHLYLTNWGSRRLILRLPAGSFDRRQLGRFLEDVDGVELAVADGNLIVDIGRDIQAGNDWDDGSGWLASLAPLRADLLGGDPRMFYLLWLAAVETEAVSEDTQEPLPGLGPLSGALEAFAAFFAIDPDLVAAAAERPAEAPVSPKATRAAIAALADADKVALLLRVAEGDRTVAAELRRLARGSQPAASSAPPRTARDLRKRASALRREREQEEATRTAAEAGKRAEEDAQFRRVRLDALRERGEDAWTDVEAEIAERNGAAYDRAVRRLMDLRDLAAERGDETFQQRLSAIRERHRAKHGLISRMNALRGGG